MADSIAAQRETRRETRSALQAATWLPLLREALASEGRFRWPLHGNSMLPTLPDDCEIEVRPLPPALRLGELIVFVIDDTLIAHRLVRRQGEYLIAQGDNRRAPDRPLHSDQVLGRVVAAYQHDQLCWPRRFSAAWRGAWLVRHQVLRVLRVLWRGGRKVIRHA
jgi:hypothetical protein